MRRIGALAVAVVVALSCIFFGVDGFINEASAAIAPKPLVHPRAAILINVTTSDIDQVMMALRTADNVLDHKKKVTVYLNVEGVQNAWAGAPQNVHAITGQTVQQALADLISRGATVAVCQMCMNRYGITEGELIPGAVLSNPDFAYFATMDMYTQVISY